MDGVSEVAPNGVSENDIEEVRDFLFDLLVLGEHLNINTEFYKTSILKLTSKKIKITEK